MPTISISRDYSTSKNLKMYLIQCMTSSMGKAGYQADLVDDFLPYSFTKENAETVNPHYLINRIPNLQEIPDLSAGEGSGNTTDTIEITTLQDAYHEYANGLKNRGDSEGDNSLAFTFLYDKNCYAGLQEARNAQNAVKVIAEVLPDTNPDVLYDYSYVAIVLPDDSYFVMKYSDFSTVFRGVGVNSALTFQLNVSLNGSVEWKTGWSDLGFASLAGSLIYDKDEELENQHHNFSYVKRVANGNWVKESF